MPSTKRIRATISGVSRAQWISAVVWADRLLCFCARWGIPAALAFVIVSGPVLPRIGGGLAPYPGLRSLHVLCGLGLVLAVLYGAGSWAFGTAQRAYGRIRHPSYRNGGRSDRPRLALSALHGVLLAVMLWSGIERYAGQRWGIALLPVLSATEWSLLHRLVAPYYLAALLIHWFVKSRVAWRMLLDQLRRP